MLFMVKDNHDNQVEYNGGLHCIQIKDMVAIVSNSSSYVAKIIKSECNTNPWKHWVHNIEHNI